MGALRGCPSSTRWQCTHAHLAVISDLKAKNKIRNEIERDKHSNLIAISLPLLDLLHGVFFEAVMSGVFPGKVHVILTPARVMWEEGILLGKIFL